MNSKVYSIEKWKNEKKNEQFENCVARKFEIENEWTERKIENDSVVIIQSTVASRWTQLQLRKKPQEFCVKRKKENQELHIVYIEINKWNKPKKCHELHLTNQFYHLFIHVP